MAAISRSSDSDAQRYFRKEHTMTQLAEVKESSASETYKVLYTAKGHTTGGRDGASRSSDGRLDVKLSSPGAPGNGTNPEQLFAAGWSACFLSAMRIAAARMKVRLPAETAIDAEVDLCNGGGDNYFLQARLNISLPGLDREVARALAEAGHQTCPYSKATRGNIEVAINLV
jgi:Ohr subfamily peroxiredoxin